MPDTPPAPLHPVPRVMAPDDAIYVDKGNGTRVHYYLFPEYEIHANVIQAGTVQGWHHHLRITETLFIVRGELEARWIDADGARRARILSQGALFDVGASVHTFANVSNCDTEFLVFRFVPDGVDKRDLIKTDRYADEILDG